MSNGHDKELFRIIDDFGKKLPRFSDGRINYTKSKVAPVTTVFVRHNGNILVLKRSNKVANYKEHWNIVAGFLDELKPLEQKIAEELKEELGVTSDLIKKVFIGKSYVEEDRKSNKQWIVFPAIVDLHKKPKIRLNEAHTKYAWVQPHLLSLFNNAVPSVRMGPDKVSE